MATLTPADIAYMEAHPNDTKIPNLVACGAITLATAYIAVALRIFARMKTEFRIGADDFITIFSLAAFTAFFVALCLTCHYGMGKHIIFVTDEKDLLISLTVTEVLYNFTTMIVKCAVLALYLRIFPVPQFRMWAWIMMAINIVGNVIFMICSIIQCLPIESRWNPSIPSVCIDYFAVVVSSGVINIVIDFAILGMPIPVINSLHIPGRKKIMLTAVFGTGAMACFISVARCIQASNLNSADATWDEVGALYISALELSVDIISACMPTYRPLISRVSEKVRGTTIGSRGLQDQYQLTGSVRTKSYGRKWSDPSDLATSTENLHESNPNKIITVSRDYQVISE